MVTLNILFTSMDSVGHVNCCLGVATLLKSRGHKITFTLKKAWEPLIKKHGFDFLELVAKEEENSTQTIEMSKKSRHPDSKSSSCCSRKFSIQEDEIGANSCCGKIQRETNISEGCCQYSDTAQELSCCQNEAKEKKESNLCCEEKQSDEIINRKEKDSKERANEFLINFIRKNIECYRRPPMEDIKTQWDPELEALYVDFYKQIHSLNDPIDEMIERIKPNVIIVDFMGKVPCLIKSSIPFVQIWSPNPVPIYGKDLPPMHTGFPTDSPKEMWEEYRQLAKIKYKKTDELNIQFLEKHGLKIKSGECENFMFFESQYFNLYPFPEALDYTDIASKPRLWFRMDSSVREPDEKDPFVLSEKLANKPGKLIFFSLGTMGSVDLELMRNVIRILAMTSYRVIVSKGPLHDQLELPDNMWGDKYVNQLAILPNVDLVITHGGNNTMTESLYHGKPMIVMPIFMDQLDNAQRIHEKKLGIRLDTYHFKDAELLDAIDRSLNDHDLHERLAKVSQKLKTSRTSQQVCDLIEKLARTKSCPID